MSAGKALAIWAIHVGKSCKEIAAALGVHRVQVSKWRHDKARPSGDLPFKIERLTEGPHQVPADMWSKAA